MEISIFGDFCPHHRVADLLENNEFSTVFGSFVEISGESDYCIVNYETVIANDTDKPIRKYGPNLHSNINSIAALQYAGVRCVTLANNHFKDFGHSAVCRTIEELDKGGIDHVGGGKSLDESQAILYKKINGEVLSIINVCENEFSIATSYSGGAAPLDIVNICRALKDAKLNADYVLLIIHGGHEYYQYPSPRMKKLYRFFIDEGADVIVNHHQHCFSGYEIYNGKPIFYGLGNLCFDWNGKRDSIWNEGYGVQLNMEKEGIGYKLLPYYQCNEEPTITFLNEDQIDSFTSKISQINDVICSDLKLECEFQKWSQNRYGIISNILGSKHNKYLNYLARRGWLKNSVTPHEINMFFDYISCESHRDTVLHFLRDRITEHI